MIPLQGGENAQMYRQTLEASRINLTPGGSEVTRDLV